jgi:hypothetical protein
MGPRTLTVEILKPWPTAKRVWLKPGETHTLDYELAKLLLSQNKARFNGSALELFKTK